MGATYYLDESGTTGDLARGGALAFDSQPIFVLACVRVDEPNSLESEIKRLKQAYRVQGPELKSKNVVRKPQFVGELVAYIRNHNLSIFIEVVEKRFNVVAYIVNHLLTIPNGTPYLPLRVLFAEHLAGYVPDELLHDYCALCLEPSVDQVRDILGTLFEIAESLYRGENAEESLTGGLLRETIRASLDALSADPTIRGVQRFLPIPDVGKNVQLNWMLPELTSLTGIYGRLNRHHGGHLSEVTLVHDEHAKFDRILLDAKLAADNLVENGMQMVLDHADYRFHEHAELLFQSSRRTAGVQLADVLAGFVMRYIQDMMVGGGLVSSQRRAVFEEILALTEVERSVGVNFVMAASDLRRIGIRY